MFKTRRNRAPVLVLELEDCVSVRPIAIAPKYHPAETLMRHAASLREYRRCRFAAGRQLAA